jgi:hypothetical protein
VVIALSATSCGVGQSEDESRRSQERLSGPDIRSSEGDVRSSESTSVAQWVTQMVIKRLRFKAFLLVNSIGFWVTSSKWYLITN